MIKIIGTILLGAFAVFMIAMMGLLLYMIFKGIKDM